jgi:phosphoserine phosphatase RsbU/P
MTPEHEAVPAAGEPPVVVPSEDAEELYEHAPCGYLSTLPDGRIVKVNQTFLTLTGYTREELVGRRRFVDLLTAGGRIYHETHYAPLLAMQGSAREIALDLVAADGARLPVLLNAVVARASDGAYVVRASVFDATDRRAYELELLHARQRAEASEERARLLARTLQSTLMPPTAPAIPGLTVGAAYRPAGAGDQVGGDFYDVFQVADGAWGVVIGDVCGKGPQAAAVTALGRYAVRAAAMSATRPSDVLEVLNATLLAHEADRFCTALFLRVHPAPDGRAEVVLASGGHPLPLLVTDDGVQPVGLPGGLLGIFPEVELHDVAIDLDPGHALFAYTDGLVDARRNGEEFGDARLVAAVAASRAGPPAGIPQIVVDAIVAFQEGVAKDDMAALLVGAPPR